MEVGVRVDMVNFYHNEGMYQWSIPRQYFFDTNYQLLPLLPTTYGPQKSSKTSFENQLFSIFIFPEKKNTSN